MMPVPPGVPPQHSGVPAPAGGATVETIATIGAHRSARSALPDPVRRKLERLERAAIAARAVVVDLGTRIDAQRERLRALEHERQGWEANRYVSRLTTAAVERHQAAEAQATAELARIERDRDEFQRRAQALGGVADTARRFLNVEG
jgi:hypothetical protein